MRVVQVNVTSKSGGTGKVCSGVSRVLTEKNIENYIIYTGNTENIPNAINIATNFEIKLQALKSRIFGNYGFNSKKITKRLIRKLDEINPDVVQLHNLHGHNVNIEQLFKYLEKNSNIKVLWTFHDCWAFTGYCPYYQLEKCEKWKKECYKCPQRKQFSWFFDKSKYLQKRKKDILLKNQFTIITPSKWLSDVVKQSFFKNYNVNIIHNGIDLDVFKPTKSDFRKKYGLENKKIVLGVSMGWEKRKGIDVFIELSKRLPQDYQIVLVGTNKNIDKKLSKNIVSIHKINEQSELAKIYTEADVFVNPTSDEVFGLVNVEALACGTPVVTFNAGGSPECINENCGSVVEIGDFNKLEQEIIRICNNKPYATQICIDKAKEFDEKIKFEEYVKFYCLEKTDDKYYENSSYSTKCTI